MEKRITAIVGAGAVMDFDFGTMPFPSSTTITNKMREVVVDDIHGNKKSVVVAIEEKIKEQIGLFRKIGYNYSRTVSFEELFHIMEVLYSYQDWWDNDFVLFPTVAALLKPKLTDFNKRSYRQALVQCMKVIIQTIDSYDTLFAKGEMKEIWYREYWKAFGNGLDVFTFNYDNTIESSLSDFEDGFLPFKPDYKRFEPKVLWNNNDKPSICHLHGNIRYGNAIPQPVRHLYSPRDLYKFHFVDMDGIEQFMFPQNQANETVVISPIITGMHKTDKMCYMPHSFYHAYFVRKIMENPSIMIIGYSFNDLYVNQIIERHKLIYAERQRIVIIDKWEIEKETDVDCLAEHVQERTSYGFKSYMGHVIWDEEGNFQNIRDHRDDKSRFIERMEPKGHYWALKDGCLRLYIEGFKNAIENHQDEIIEYLNSNG